MDLSEMKPEDVIHPACWAEYESKRDVVWWQLVRLNSTLHVLRHIGEFPFGVLFPTTPMHFFQLTFRTLVDMALLIIDRLANNSRHGPGALFRFRNLTMTQVREEFRPDLREALRVSRLTNMQKCLQRIGKIRDHFVAHLDKDMAVADGVPPELQVTLQDLEEVSEALGGLFNVLCFGVEHTVLPLEYLPGVQHPQGTDPRTDIERILDSLAEQSLILRLPEKRLTSWNAWKKKHSPEELEIVNRYRVKLNLPAA